MISSTKLKRFLWLSLIAAFLNGFSGCVPSAKPSAAGAGASTSLASNNSTDKKGMKNVRVQLAFLFQSVDAPLVIAINKGYFAKEGLNVSYERGFGNVDAISKLGTGTFDIAFSDMYNALDFNDKNSSDRVLAVAVPFNQAPFAVLTLKGSGINSPKELTGKKIGAPAGDGPRKLFPLFAKAVNVDPNSLAWSTMEPKLRETFLLQGKVDAISGFSTSALPNLIKGGKQRGDINIFYYKDYGLDFYGNAILAKASYIKQNPEIIKAFVKAYLRGLQDVLQDPDAGLDAVMAADESKLMNRDVEKVRLQVAINDLIVSPETEKLGLGEVDPKRLEKNIQQTVQGFGLKSNPRVADIFTHEFLPVKQERSLPAASERKPLS